MKMTVAASATTEGVDGSALSAQQRNDPGLTGSSGWALVFRVPLLRIYAPGEWVGASSNRRLFGYSLGNHRDRKPWRRLTIRVWAYRDNHPLWGLDPLALLQEAE